MPASASASTPARSVAESCLTRSRRRLRRRWPGVSAGLSLERPARRTPGRAWQDTQINAAQSTAAQVAGTVPFAIYSRVSTTYLGLVRTSRAIDSEPLDPHPPVGTLASARKTKTSRTVQNPPIAGAERSMITTM